MKKYLTLTILFCSLQSYADCFKVEVDVAKVKKLSQQLSQRIASDLIGISKLMWSWHSTLSEYEGKTVKFPIGYFEAIADSAHTTQRNIGVFRTGFSDLDLQLDELLRTIETCQH